MALGCMEKSNNSNVKLSSLKLGNWFYHPELKMVCLVYEQYDGGLWFISSDGDTHFHDCKSFYTNLVIEPIDDIEDWSVYYKKYPRFDLEIRNGLLLYMMNEVKIGKLSADISSLEKERSLVKKSSSDLINRIVERNSLYEKIDLLESNKSLALKELEENKVVLDNK